MLMALALFACGDDKKKTEENITVTYESFDTLGYTVTIENRTGLPIDASVFDGMFDAETGPNKTKIENALNGLSIVIEKGVPDNHWQVDVSSKTIFTSYAYVNNGLSILRGKLRNEILIKNTFAAAKSPDTLLLAALQKQKGFSL